MLEGTLGVPHKFSWESEESGYSGGWSPQPRQALSLRALSSITCSGCYLEPLPLVPWASLTLASHEDEEQNHLSLIGLEATKAIGAHGEQAPGEGAGTTS